MSVCSRISYDFCHSREFYTLRFLSLCNYILKHDICFLRDKPCLVLLLLYNKLFLILYVYQLNVSKYSNFEFKLGYKCSSLRHTPLWKYGTLAVKYFKFWIYSSKQYHFYSDLDTPLVYVECWTEHLVVPYVRIPTNALWNCGFLLLIRSSSIPTCFGIWLLSSWGLECLISYLSVVLCNGRVRIMTGPLQTTKLW
jgi:hypothetical protein